MAEMDLNLIQQVQDKWMFRATQRLEMYRDAISDVCINDDGAAWKESYKHKDNFGYQYIKDTERSQVDHKNYYKSNKSKSTIW